MSYLKIYIDDKPLYLCDEITEEINTLKSQEDTVYKEGISTYYFHVIPHEIRKPNYNQAIIFHDNLPELQQAFFEQFKTIQAGGGLVTNDQNEILFIFRNDKWDLPKGKLDPGETIEDCAVREVMEETGVQNVVSEGKIGTTFHTYSHDGTLVLKQTDWFRMKASGIQKTVPQEKEGITEIKWVKKEDLAEYLKNTYATIAELLQKNA